MAGERLKSETAKAYDAFCRYRDMGKNRSFDKVAASYDKPLGPWGRSSYVNQLEKWSKKYGWMERVLAWVDEQTTRDREVARKERDDMVKRHVNIAITMQGKAIEKLRILDPDELTPTEIRQYLMDAVELERMSRGEPTEIVKEQHEGNLSLSYSFAKMSDKEIDGFLQQRLNKRQQDKSVKSETETGKVIKLG